MQTAISTENVQSFPTLERFLLETNSTISQELLSSIKCHCQMLAEGFEGYFREDYTEQNWIRNPFIDLVPETLTMEEKESLIELSCDGTLKAEYNNFELNEFWLRRRTEYGMLSVKAVKFLIPFTTTYLCESGFSAMLHIKNKYRTKLNFEPDLRLKLSSIEPNLELLVSNIQAQRSH